MKALVYDRYGPPEVLELREIDRPAPAADEVLVRVHAASLNAWDWDLLTGAPLIRLFSPLRPPHPVLGCDIAGRVQVVGEGVRGVEVGDAVFGDISGAGWGGLAEYVCVPGELVARKPAAMTFAQAAAVPQAGVLALQGLRRFGKLAPDHRVLINGAGGGVGTFAVQLAQAGGAEVTGVDRAEKLPMLRELGADHVVDHNRENFTRSGHQYDLILDVVGRRSAFELPRALRPGGAYVMVGGRTVRIAQVLLLGPAIRWVTGKRAGLLMHRPNRGDLEELAARFESGEITPVIDTCCALSEAPEALRRFGQGEVQGKAVVVLYEEPGDRP